MAPTIDEKCREGPRNSFHSAATVYERFGKIDPFYAVLSLRRFKKSRFDQDEFFRHGRDQVESLVAKVFPRHPNLRRDRAMDFGCGVGRLTNPLAGHFADVVGVDVSSTMIEQALRSRTARNCTFVVNKRPDLSSFSGGQFDFILSDITIQHIPPPASENYIREFVRLLRPGGLAVFLVPDGPDHRTGSIAERTSRFYREVVRPLLKRIRGKHPVQIHPISQQRVDAIVTACGGTTLHREVHPDFARSYRRFKPTYFWVGKRATAKSSYYR
jgi:SAM-dependent methyltransferase